MPPSAPRRPKHRAILEALQREIAAGAFGADGRLPGEVALARRFGVSRPTAAHALAGLRELGLIVRAAGKGTFLRRRRPDAGGFLGLVGSGLGRTEILGPLGDALARAAEAQGFRLLLGDAGCAERDAEALCRSFVAGGVSGAFLAPLETVANRELANRRLAAGFAAAGIPLVLLDRDLLDFPARSRHDLVAVDDVRAGCRLARHLLERGCRRLAFVARPSPPSTTDLRLAGCRAAVAAVAGAALAFRTGDPGDPAFCAGLLAGAGCDAVIGANDATAAAVLAALVAQGVRVPGRVRIAGFDDVAAAAAGPVPLTTMRLPCRELALLAVRTLLERIREPGLPPRQVLADAALVVRRSTGAPRPAGGKRW